MHEIVTQGFLFPNEIHVHWSIMIVLYPYITGLVAGAFIVSSLYHVFGVEELKPIAKFSLVGAFCFLRAHRFFFTWGILNGRLTSCSLPNLPRQCPDLAISIIFI